MQKQHVEPAVNAESHELHEYPGRPRRSYSRLDTLSDYSRFFDKRRGYSPLDTLSSFSHFDDKRYSPLDTLSSFSHFDEKRKPVDHERR